MRVMLSRGLFIGVLLVSSALLYEFYCPLERADDEVRVLAASWEVEIASPQKMPGRIAIGVNSNLDLIVPAIDLLTALNAVASVPMDHSNLSSVSNLEQVVGYSMEHCAGIERVYTDQREFLHTVETAKRLEHTYHIGGNAALMADKVKQLAPELQVSLVGPVGPTLRHLLHKDIVTPSFSPSSQEEVHMILEYPKAAQWGEVTATCANRVIYSHDLSNSKLVALEQFRDSIEIVKPDLIILSGAHLLDSQPADFQKTRLADIADLLDNIPSSIPVHWELATVGDLHYFNHLSDTLFSRIDSLGLNEQELLSAAVAAKAAFDFPSIPRKPLVGHVSDLLQWLMRTFSQAKGSRLTRVHFHSLTFHIIASLSGGPWRNNKQSVMAGARIAGLQACDTNKISPEQFELRLNSFQLSVTDDNLSKTIYYNPLTNASVHWTRDAVNFDLSPVLVCKNPTKTVGLGDAISSVGLLYSNFQLD